MNMQEKDIDARVSRYYLDFDRIVEDNGLVSMLVQNLSPEVVKLEVERMLEFTHREARTDDVKRYELVVERALRQQQYHQAQQDTKKKPEPHPGSDKRDKAPRKKREEALPKKKRAAAPRSGCLVCKGEHCN
ncbi:TPA: hypothetical protein N0F65_001716 [Lagenidium giganteum]|uniref:Uncharacterized protein n=1 Tax=Lagenidium giganteum TaxID=4803 RepID=A0AAV2Z282_9STRA|nr:TPA: hypothetical protein N0F65_001716 [Lagenidium giganteum]